MNAQLDLYLVLLL